jgi:uncharacterized membrane protein
MSFDQAVVVIYILDDKIKMKQAVYFIVKVIIGIAFFGIFVGIFAFFSLREVDLK